MPDPVPPARRDEGLGVLLRKLCSAYWESGAEPEDAAVLSAIVEVTNCANERIRAAESAAFARGRAEGIEEAAKDLPDDEVEAVKRLLREHNYRAPHETEWAAYDRTARALVWYMRRALLGGADRGPQ